MGCRYVFFWNTRKILYETCFNSTPFLKLCLANTLTVLTTVKWSCAKDIIFRILTV